jgi:transcription elongation factor Elf1
MKSRLEHAGHLIRLALVFAVGLGVFAGVRGLLVPSSFGQYGHYRGDSLREIAARAPLYAGRDACADCHQDIVDLKKTGKHANIGCEACHGPLAKHANDPGALTPKKPDTAVLCAICHEANAAKPKNFPQVNAKEHSGGMACGECHQAHRPKIDTGGK